MSFIVSPTRFEIDHHAAIFAGQAYAATHGSLPDTPMWRMLERRYELAPIRFQHWHPNIALILERAERHGIDAPHLPLSPWRDPPGVPLALCEPPSRTASQVTPEPPSWVMGVASVAMFVCGRWCVRKVRAERDAEGLEEDGRG